jgi:hypothetical protein
MRHNHVLKSLVPLRISFPSLLKMITPSIVKVIEYPSLYNCPTERSELFAMARKKFSTAATAMSSVMSNDIVWVESIVAQLGSPTRKGLIHFVLLRQ